MIIRGSVGPEDSGAWVEQWETDEAKSYSTRQEGGQGLHPLRSFNFRENGPEFTRPSQPSVEHHQMSPAVPSQLLKWIDKGYRWAPGPPQGGELPFPAKMIFLTC